jgi:hypothetical protein
MLLCYHAVGADIFIVTVIVTVQTLVPSLQVITFEAKLSRLKG